MSILVEINTDSELETTTQNASSNGSSSTREPEPSDLLITEDWLSLINKDIDTESVSLLS